MKKVIFSILMLAGLAACTSTNNESVDTDTVVDTIVVDTVE